MTPWPTLKRAALAIALFLGAASSSTAVLAQEDGYVLREDATPFTRAELYTYLAGRTQVWDPNGGAYYAEVGCLEPEELTAAPDRLTTPTIDRQS